MFNGHTILSYLSYVLIICLRKSRSKNIRAVVGLPATELEMIIARVCVDSGSNTHDPADGFEGMWLVIQK